VKPADCYSTNVESKLTSLASLKTNPLIGRHYIKTIMTKTHLFNTNICTRLFKIRHIVVWS